MKRILVIGGGPAGLAAAIHAARIAVAVLILERNDQCGVKLLATGGGRANVGNLSPPEEWPARFGRHGRFILPALGFFPRKKLCDWLAGMGAPVHSPDGFHLFPISNSAKEVRNALTNEAKRLGVEIRRNARAEGFSPGEGGFSVSAGGREFAADRVIIATGGNSLPSSGSTWDGCRLAEAVGHRVRPAFPGLVGLCAANLDPALAGLVLPGAEVFFRPNGGKKTSGGRELLLTHSGISGPAVLDLSAAVAQALTAKRPAAVAVRIRWLSGMDRRAWLKKLEEWRTLRGAVAVSALLREFLPARLGCWLCRRAGIAEAANAAGLRAAGRDRLVELLAGFPAEITATEGWEKAMITRGGVEVRQVDPETLESRRVRGLHFAGETLDVDGPCGGYNLHWAFASGALAGTAAAKSFRY
ncbi:MAG: aminoacetone oxidase family FAD-binding enzyme [Planctomycetes bacterium]|nr:aminoacetone oxidase family FAD-binding enzyme [Planctomycetota bacterium]